MRRFHHLTSISDVSNFSVFSSFRVLLGFPIKRLGADCGRVKHEGHILSPWTSQPEVGVPLHLGKMNTLNRKNGGGWFRWYSEISILVIWEGSSCLKFPGCDPESSQTDHDFSSSSMSDVLMSLLHLGGGPPTESCLEKRVDLLILSFGIHHDFGELGCFTYLIPRGSFFLPRFQWMVWSRIEGSSEFSESVGSSS